MFVDNKISAVPKSDMFELVMHVPNNTVRFASSKCRDGTYFWAIFMWMKIIIRPVVEYSLETWTLNNKR